MAINKNFVIKNGVQVATDLIVGDSDTKKVGIGTTIAGYTLHVGATNVGGRGFQFATNTAQAGDLTSITLSQAESREASSINGSRIIITEGPGAAAYNKIADGFIASGII